LRSTSSTAWVTRAINGVHCHDTAPAFPGDPMYPYAGKLIRDLTLAEIKTLDCGFTDPGFPQQVRVPTFGVIAHLSNADAVAATAVFVRIGKHRP
jgi:hypothetical protein